MVLFVLMAARICRGGLQGELATVRPSLPHFSGALSVWKNLTCSVSNIFCNRSKTVLILNIMQVRKLI